jgi:hypothetical protein
LRFFLRRKRSLPIRGAEEEEESPLVVALFFIDYYSRFFVVFFFFFFFFFFDVLVLSHIACDLTFSSYFFILVFVVLLSLASGLAKKREPATKKKSNAPKIVKFSDQLFPFSAGSGDHSHREEEEETTRRITNE